MRLVVHGLRERPPVGKIHVGMLPTPTTWGVAPDSGSFPAERNTQCVTGYVGSWASPRSAVHPLRLPSMALARLMMDLADDRTEGSIPWYVCQTRQTATRFQPTDARRISWPTLRIAARAAIFAPRIQTLGITPSIRAIMATVTWSPVNPIGQRARSRSAARTTS
jgi:hypothetical protein